MAVVVLLHETNEENLHDNERDIKTVIMEGMDSHGFMDAWPGEERIPRVCEGLSTLDWLSTGCLDLSLDSQLLTGLRIVHFLVLLSIYSILHPAYF